MRVSIFQLLYVLSAAGGESTSRRFLEEELRVEEPEPRTFAWESVVVGVEVRTQLWKHVCIIQKLQYKPSYMWNIDSQKRLIMK